MSLFDFGAEKRKTLVATVYELRSVPKGLAKNGTFIEIVVMGEFCRETKRTGTIFDSKNPLWEETLNLNIPEEGEKVIIYFKSVSRKNDRVKIVGTHQISVGQFNSFKNKEEWFSIELDAEIRTSKKMPKVRLGLNYMEDVLLSEKDYQPMIDYLLEDVNSLLYLSTFVTKNHLDYSTVLCKIFDSVDPSYLIKFISEVLKREIEGYEDASVLFRANTLGSKLLEFYLDMRGGAWRNAILAPLISELMALEESFKDQIMEERNLDYIMDFNTRLLNNIYESHPQCPPQIRYILNVISEHTSKKFDDPEVTHISISSFIMLRLFSPAILCPKLFGLSNDYPSKVQTDNCTVVSSVLQKLANLSTFRENVEKLQIFNDLLLSEQENMRKFVSELSQPVKETEFILTDRRSEILDFEYAVFSRFFIRAFGKLATDPHFHSDKFKAILDDIIFKVYEEYPEYWSEQHDLDEVVLRHITSVIREKDPNNPKKSIQRSLTLSDRGRTRSSEGSIFSRKPIRNSEKHKTSSAHDLLLGSKARKHKLKKAKTKRTEGEELKRKSFKSGTFSSKKLKKFSSGKRRSGNPSQMQQSIVQKEKNKDDSSYSESTTTTESKSMCLTCNKAIKSSKKDYVFIGQHIYHSKCVECKQCGNKNLDQLTPIDSHFKCTDLCQ